MEVTKQTAVEQLLNSIPTGQEIKQAIFDNDMDEKMLDEWLFEKIYKCKDWLDLEKQQIIDAFERKHSYSSHLVRMSFINQISVGEQYYNETYGKANK